MMNLRRKLMSFSLGIMASLVVTQSSAAVLQHTISQPSFATRALRFADRATSSSNMAILALASVGTFFALLHKTNRDFETTQNKKKNEYTLFQNRYETCAKISGVGLGSSITLPLLKWGLPLFVNKMVLPGVRYFLVNPLTRPWSMSTLKPLVIVAGIARLCHVIKNSISNDLSTPDWIRDGSSSASSNSHEEQEHDA